MPSHFLDNLIPLHTRLSHLQLAGWTPTRVAEEGLGCRLLADVMIPMPDGVRLAADVYVPRRAGRYPVILSFAAYNIDLHTTGAPTGSNEIGVPPIATDRGYVRVVVTARGVGRSEGQLQPWLCEAQRLDHLRCVEWAAEQDWSNGSVCLFGTSYYGMTQPGIAALRPPMLKAFFCNEICTDFRRHVFRYGGTFNSDFFSLWAGANFTPGAIKRHVPPLLRAALSHVVNRPWLFRLMQPHIDKIMAGLKRNQPSDDALALIAALASDTSDGLAEPFWDGPYRELANIEVPFVVAQNRGNITLHQFGAYDLFEHAGTRREARHLIIAPAEYELPVYAWQLESLAFFDHYVKGVDNGYDRLARVRYWRDGAGDWGTADDMPPQDATVETLNLKPQNRLEAGAAAGGSVHWLSIPPGVSTVPGLAPQLLTFDWTAPRDVELLGPVTLNLRFSCNEIDSYVVARLDRIDGGGKSHCLSLGHLRPARRKIDASTGSRNEIAIDSRSIEPLTPDVPVLLRFSLTPAAAVIRSGERLRLTIASRTDLVSPKVHEGFLSLDYPMPPYFGRNTIHFGEDSALEISLRNPFAA